MTSLNRHLQSSSSVDTFLSNSVNHNDAFSALSSRFEGLCVHTYLLFVLFGVRQHGGHVKHDLVPLVHGIHRTYPCGIICKTQASISRAQRILGLEGNSFYVWMAGGGGAHSHYSPKAHSGLSISGEAALRILRRWGDLFLPFQARLLSDARLAPRRRRS